MTRELGFRPLVLNRLRFVNGRFVRDYWLMRAQSSRPRVHASVRPSVTRRRACFVGARPVARAFNPGFVRSLTSRIRWVSLDDDSLRVALQ